VLKIVNHTELNEKSSQSSINPAALTINYEPAPKSQKRRLDTKTPRHQFTQNIVYQHIKIDEF
jgi:hypothetical protein